MPPLPRYDLAFRFERALRPDGLRIIETCTRAVCEAIDDAKRAGRTPETDPAVQLLGRHLGRIASGGDPEQTHAEDGDLRRACLDWIARLRSVDTLVLLIRRGIGADPECIRIYQSAARERLRDLAHTLGLDHSAYDLRRAIPSLGPAPIIELATDSFSVSIDPGRFEPSSEVGYWRTKSRSGGWTSSQTRTDIGVLADLARFARTLRRELHLPARRNHRFCRKETVMGWLSMPLSSMYPHTGPKGYLDAQCTYEHFYNSAGERVGASTGQPDPEGTVCRGLRVIASSCLRNKVYYAAVTPRENGNDGVTFAIICLIKWTPRARDGYVFAYKDMDESAGPYETECPKRILDLLDPTDDPTSLDWRRKCIKNLARTARKLEDGMRIKLPSSVKFTDGHEGSEFVVRKRGRKTRLALSLDGPAPYRISGLARMDWTVVPQTRIHKTVFA